MMKRPGFEDKERNMMMIPLETRDGIYITGEYTRRCVHLDGMLCCSIIIC